MAAGLSKRQRWGISYRFLKTAIGRLAAKGIVARYADGAITGEHNGHSFDAGLAWASMSNGETVGILWLRVDRKQINPPDPLVEKIVTFCERAAA